MKAEDVEISVFLKIPKNYYQVASGLVKIYGYDNFDSYVADIVKRDIDMLLDGAVPLQDQLHYKLTGKDSPYIQDIKKRFGPINKLDISRRFSLEIEANDC